MVGILLKLNVLIIKQIIHLVSLFKVNVNFSFVMELLVKVVPFLMLVIVKSYSRYYKIYDTVGDNVANIKIYHIIHFTGD